MGLGGVAALASWGKRTTPNLDQPSEFDTHSNSQATQSHTGSLGSFFFFKSYNFHPAYCPGSKNAKVEALSRQFSHSTICAALSAEPAPSKTPAGRSLPKSSGGFAHFSLLSGHPDPNMTLQLLRRVLWWQSVGRMSVRLFLLMRSVPGPRPPPNFLQGIFSPSLFRDVPGPTSSLILLLVFYLLTV